MRTDTAAAYTFSGKRLLQFIAWPRIRPYVSLSLSTSTESRLIFRFFACQSTGSNLYRIACPTEEYRRHLPAIRLRKAVPLQSIHRIKADLLMQVSGNQLTPSRCAQANMLAASLHYLFHVKQMAPGNLYLLILF